MFSSSIVWAVGGWRQCRAAQHGVLVQDVVELDLESRQLVLVEAQPGEVRHVLDVAAGERCHAPIIADRPRQPART